MTTGPACGADPAASYQAPTTLQHRRFLSPSTQTDPCRELDASQLLIRCVPTNLSSTVLHLGRAHSWTRIPPWGRDDRVAHQQDISAACAGECVWRTLDAATMFPAVAHAATGLVRPSQAISWRDGLRWHNPLAGRGVSDAVRDGVRLQYTRTLYIQTSAALFTVYSTVNILLVCS